MVKEINQKELKDEVTNSDKIVLVDFYADWCMPCKMMAPVLEKLSNDFSSEIAVLKINTDHNEQASRAFEIFSIPTLVIFKDGKMATRLVGFNSADKIMDTVRKLKK
ncbi:MAG TPA: thioredoxin [Bacilli bacterium]|nr:thioredoxin [Bacilli bacterium]